MPIGAGGERAALGNGLLGQEEDGLCRPLLVACSGGESVMQPLFSWKQQPIRSYTRDLKTTRRTGLLCPLQNFQGVWHIVDL